MRSLLRRTRFTQRLRFISLVMCVTCLTGQAAYANALDVYISLITGTFDTSAQAKSDDRYDHAIWHIVEIWTDRDDGPWLYTENWMAGAEKPYRQRVSHYKIDENGGITSAGYIIPDTDQYIGAAQNISMLADLSPDVLIATGSCPTYVARTGPMRFESSTVGQRCQNSYKGASYVVSRNILEKDQFTNWDRGFTADGELVWGPAAGGYQFRRSSTME